jgi:hypothetical protein
MSRKDAEHGVATREVTKVLERFIDELPEHFRTVSILRSVEQLSLKETGSGIGGFRAVNLNGLAEVVVGFGSGSTPIVGDYGLSSEGDCENHHRQLGGLPRRYFRS